MIKNAFKLTTKQLVDIAEAMQRAIEEGLQKDKADLLCLPTFITPKTPNDGDSALVLDLGGTNYRMALVNFNEGKSEIIPDGGCKKDLQVMKSEGFSEADLMRELAEPLGFVKPETTMPVGYCFSFPAESMENGDAKLVHWNKGVNIPEMIGKPVGESVLKYFSDRCGFNLTDIKVINDTIASLFAGCASSGYDSYIGLIVGTGTNMASFISADKVDKLNGKHQGMIPINLETGGFIPPHLTAYDIEVDAKSSNKGMQRFEKAISGFYIGEVLKSAYPALEFDDKFDGEKLCSIINYPDIYKDEVVETARDIYRRSAELVAASIAGLILTLRSHDESIKKVLLTAEGGLYWSCIMEERGMCYHDIVLSTLDKLLAEVGLNDIVVDINKIDNANLIGTAVAALS